MTDDMIQYPHCDSRVLHAPSECDYCDMHPDWQQQRIHDGICFTGQTPTTGNQPYPCPADAARPPGSPSDHRRWGGNKPTSAEGDPSWPMETFASQVMYGDQGGREQWSLQERIKIRLMRPIENRRMKRRGYRKQDGWWVYP